MRRMKFKAAPIVARGSSKKQSIPTKVNNEKTSIVKKDDICNDKGELEPKQTTKLNPCEDEVDKSNEKTYNETLDRTIHKNAPETMADVPEIHNADNSTTENVKCTDKEEQSNVADTQKEISPDQSNDMAIDERLDLCHQVLNESSSGPPEKNDADITLNNEKKEISRRKKIKVTPAFNKIKKENPKNCLERMNDSIDKDVNEISISVNNESDAVLMAERTDSINNENYIKEKSNIEMPHVENMNEKTFEKDQSVEKSQSNEFEIGDNQTTNIERTSSKDLSASSKLGSIRRSKIRAAPTLLTMKKKIKQEKDTNICTRGEKSADDYPEQTDNIDNDNFIKENTRIEMPHVENVNEKTHEIDQSVEKSQSNELSIRENQTTNITETSVKDLSAPTKPGSSRRSKIRAAPSLFTNKKKIKLEKDTNISTMEDKSEDDYPEQTDSIDDVNSLKEKIMENVNEIVKEKGQSVDKSQNNELDIRENQNVNSNEISLKDSSAPSKPGSTRRSKIRTAPTLLTNKKKTKLEKDTNICTREDDTGVDYSKKENEKEKSMEGSMKVKYENCSNLSNITSEKDLDNFGREDLNVKESGNTSKSDKNIDLNSKKRESNSEDLTSSDKTVKEVRRSRLSIKLEEDKAKTVFRERKSEYHKKVKEGPLERKGMTMFDLIFFNPQNNPMPAPKNKKKDNLNEDRNEGEISENQREEEMVDDLGLDGTNTEDNQVVNSLESTDKPNPSEENKEDSKANIGDESDGEDNVFGPKLKIGADGEIIIDEESLVIKTTASKEKDIIMSNTVLVEEENDDVHYGRHNKKRRRSCEWTINETARFYKALSTVGTDFSLMEQLFSWRSRAELKIKFKKEERNYRSLVERALRDDKQFDFTIFDESDYDPEEDRKIVKKERQLLRIEERKEAKRIKKEREEMNTDLSEVEKKKKAIAERKQRKTVLKNVFKNKGTKKDVNKEKKVINDMQDKDKVKRKYKKREVKPKVSSTPKEKSDKECKKRSRKSPEISKRNVSKRKCKKSKVIISDSSSDEGDMDMNNDMSSNEENENDDISPNKENMEEESKNGEIQSNVGKCSDIAQRLLMKSDAIDLSNCNIIGEDDTDQWIEQEINSPMPSKEVVDLISENLLSKVDTSNIIDQDGQISGNDSMENLNESSLPDISNDTISEHIDVDEDETPYSENMMSQTVMKADRVSNNTMQGQSENIVNDFDALIQSSVKDKVSNENYHGDIPLERISESVPSNNTKSADNDEVINIENKRIEDKTIESCSDSILKTDLVENSNNVKFADEIPNCEETNVYETHEKDIDIGEHSNVISNTKKTDLKKADKKVIKDKTENMKDYSYPSSNDERISGSLPDISRKTAKSSELIENNSKGIVDTAVENMRNNVLKTDLVENLVDDSNNVKFADKTLHCKTANVNETHERDIDIGQASNEMENIKKIDSKKTSGMIIKDKVEELQVYNNPSINNEKINESLPKNGIKDVERTELMNNNKKSENIDKSNLRGNLQKTDLIDNSSNIMFTDNIANCENSNVDENHGKDIGIMQPSNKRNINKVDLKKTDKEVIKDNTEEFKNYNNACINNEKINESLPSSSTNNVKSTELMLNSNKSGDIDKNNSRGNVQKTDLVENSNDTMLTDEITNCGKTNVNETHGKDIGMRQPSNEKTNINKIDLKKTDKKVIKNNTEKLRDYNNPSINKEKINESLPSSSTKNVESTELMKNNNKKEDIDISNLRGNVERTELVDNSSNIMFADKIANCEKTNDKEINRNGIGLKQPSNEKTNNNNFDLKATDKKVIKDNTEKSKDSKHPISDNGKNSESLPSSSTETMKNPELIKNNIKSEVNSINDLRNSKQKTDLVANSINIKREKTNVNETQKRIVDIRQPSNEEANAGKTDLKKTTEKIIKDKTEKVKGPNDRSSSSSNNVSKAPAKGTMWHPQKFPVSDIITDLQGKRFIKVATAHGSVKHVPVPVLPPGTSNIVVVGGVNPQGNEVYHVFAVAPPVKNGS